MNENSLRRQPYFCGFRGVWDFLGFFGILGFFGGRILGGMVCKVGRKQEGGLQTWPLKPLLGL